MVKQDTAKLSVGSKIQVKTGTAVPEFPEFACDGWAGVIREVSGKRPQARYIIEWDDRTLEKMPSAYREKCEEQGLYFRMACLDANTLESAAE